MRLLFACALLVAYSSASAQTVDAPAAATETAGSKVVTIRTSSLVGVANKYKVAFDDREIYSLRSGQYAEFPVTEGEHRVAVKCFGGWSPTWKQQSLSFMVSPQQITYFKIHPNGTCAGIEIINAKEAEKLIRKSKKVEVGVPEPQ